MKKIVTIVGARPQFIKAAMVSRALKTKGFSEIIVHTGQHFDKNMSEVFFEEMEIPHPDYNLGIQGLSHGAMTGRMMESIEDVLLKEKPDGVMVFGDTNSTLAGALAAAKLNIPVAHVEAGLRSFNNQMPEEINRILTDRISSVLFCPTDVAVGNLKKEGFDNFDCQIVKSGDVMQDAALFYAEKSDGRSTILKKLDLEGKAFVLATVHRQENTDNPERVQAIFNSLNAVHQDKTVVMPLHPRTRQIIKNLGIGPAFRVIGPVGYFDMLQLLKNCQLVFTDSGGLQKEAFFFAKHCVTLREETEWTELVEGGFNKLSGSDCNRILDAYQAMSAKQSDFSVNLYGDGEASKVIADFLATL
ncbi:non-hydrolyzing UDP-N-acetylglucosamine 2-epimerase [Prolixibacter sp. SD074]|uniref:non-hydrolyzing UDP-N-acetylglucosamine 2-epimerase n=1 Tax=Prolixibacter sp. SD074 TaxID=2652391 RepID=UPI001289B2B8|nr:UDP-N-acetylglucosamine 2-epimerase (non-hydrolyzing) [Prolixibacter sp. SD074]GET30604.1 UDP-2,3-diacetamido-2,3-dideoxy-D-glucuronate 2-epimerase [Prolixibacter sp. SD074]